MSKGKHTEDLIIGLLVTIAGVYGYAFGFNSNISVIFIGVGAFFCGWWFSNWDKYRHRGKLNKKKK